MPTTIAECERRVRAALGGQLPATSSVAELVDQAASLFYGLRVWNFRKRLGRLSLRANITLTGCTWTESTKTLGKTGAFSAYSFLAGDEARVTGGTGATTGYYQLASKASANGVVLESSIGAAADGQVDIAASFALDSVALPSDFEEMLDIGFISSASGSLRLTTIQTINQMRQSSTTLTGSSYWVAIRDAQLAAGGAPVSRLEIYPAPQANSVNAISIAYRCRWPGLPSNAKDDFQIQIPEYARGFFLEMLSLYARSIENNARDGFSPTLAMLMSGPEYQACVSRDGLKQHNFGSVTMTALEMEDLGMMAGELTADASVLDPS